jgi:1-acyl-sn-glycerol-3-phosphate acyltransferase
MRLPRMTTRRWMIAVVIGAVLFGAMEISQRRKRFRFLSNSYHMAAEMSLIEVGPPAPAGSPEAEARRRLVTYYEQLGRKYERAASRPWLPVAPDPPAPK